MTSLCLARLDRKRRDLLKQKEDLLKESKAKAATMESVRSQIELLIRVRHYSTRPSTAFSSSSTQTATEVQKKVDDLVVPIQNPSSSAAN